MCCFYDCLFLFSGRLLYNTQEKIVGFTQFGSEFTPILQAGTLVLSLSMAPYIALKKSKEMAFLVEKLLMEIFEITGLLVVLVAHA